MIDTLFIVGPTAVGKTEYAINKALEINGEIVSADSMQIYKYMDIGSAKPTAEERSLVKHYLVDEIDPRSKFSVFDFQNLALKYIKEISDKGKIPIVCGGTGLYINSLVYDMDFSAPVGDEAYREKIKTEENNDPIRISNRLRKLDKDAADAIHPNNIKRMLRAIERLEKGEGKLAEFAKATSPSKLLNPKMIGLDMDRNKLYTRINERVDKLFDMGLENEIRSLMSMGFTSDDVAMKGIGYKEVIDAISLGLPAESAKETIKSNTRHYARRQLIWFRRYPQIEWIML